MIMLKTMLSAVAGILLAALVLAAFAPKAVRAVVATLVQVANTTSNPVPVSDVAGQEPYQTECISLTQGTLNACSFTLPPGKRFLIREVGMHAVLNGGQLYVAAVIISNGDSTTRMYVNTPFQGSGFGGQAFYSATQPVYAYADSTASVGCELDSTTVYPAASQLNCDLYGYLVPQP